MFAGKTVSYKAIMDKQMRDWGFDIDDEAGIEWLAEFMAHTNVGVVMEHKIAYVTVCDGRADLPYDVHKIEQIGKLEDVNNLTEAECAEGNIYPMRWATDHFHTRYHKDDRDYTSTGLHTYTVSENSVFTSFTEGYIAIAYDAIPTDADGYPVVPAEQQWLEAAAHELAWKYARKQWLADQLADKKYHEIKTEREWYFAQAVNHARQWGNVDQAESAKNAAVRTIPDLQSHASFFANFQLPEQRHFRDKAFGASLSVSAPITTSNSNVAE